MNEALSHSTSLPQRLYEGFERIASVMRGEQWSASSAQGLNPAQLQVLRLLAARENRELRVKAIAAHMGVSAPAVTDTLAALERKGLVAKSADLADTRAVLVNITPQGRSVLDAIKLVPSDTDVALAQLSASEQADLLLLQIKLIRLLQNAGTIPVQRMCITCLHFRPNVYVNALKPHHCAFVNLAFGDRDLRLDCGEHETAESSVQTATWRNFTQNGSESLQAQPKTEGSLS